MTIVGASLLAFYTWDRHWLIRYTLMPGMLALFTAGLARAGTWIAAKSSDFFGTASMLRGAAIGLLPVNSMAVALLSRDEAVSQKLLAVSAMGLIYVVLAGWGLWRWCRAGHSAPGTARGVLMGGAPTTRGTLPWPRACRVAWHQRAGGCCVMPGMPPHASQAVVCRGARGA